MFNTKSWDDTFFASKCGLQLVQVNALVNKFMESKKLYCPELKVHDAPMKRTSAEKYLRDMISKR